MISRKAIQPALSVQRAKPHHILSPERGAPLNLTMP
jgi:hypothetical protein